MGFVLENYYLPNKSSGNNYQINYTSFESSQI